MTKRKSGTCGQKIGGGCLGLFCIAIAIFLATPNRTPPTIRATATEQGARPRASATADATDTPKPAATGAQSTATGFRSLSDDLRVTPMADVPLMYVMNTANARSCPSTDCAVVATLAEGETFGADGAARGDPISGNSLWYRTKLGLDREAAWVHSSLVVNYDSVAQPQQQVQNPPADKAFRCPSNCDGAVSMGLSAQQAATCPGLDRDGDGVACYGD